MQKVLFIDRDGTIILEPEDYQVDKLEKLCAEFQKFSELSHKRGMKNNSGIAYSNSELNYAWLFSLFVQSELEKQRRNYALKPELKNGRNLSKFAEWIKRRN